MTPLAFIHHHRVRYAECDPMGIVYYTRYLEFFEAARTEALRHMGLAYKTLEDQGIIMPVVDAQLKYHQPAQYDDLLAITTFFEAPPRVRLRIGYEVRRADDPTLLVTGQTTLCFVDPARNRPIPAPSLITDVFEKHFPIETSA